MRFRDRGSAAACGYIYIEGGGAGKGGIEKRNAHTVWTSLTLCRSYNLQRFDGVIMNSDLRGERIRARRLQPGIGPSIQIAVGVVAQGVEQIIKCRGSESM